ncbi:hypothetical protein Tco_0206052 [Tanacetum coccineum]
MTQSFGGGFKPPHHSGALVVVGAWLAVGVQWWYDDDDDDGGGCDGVKVRVVMAYGGVGCGVVWIDIDGVAREVLDARPEYSPGNLFGGRLMVAGGWPDPAVAAGKERENGVSRAKLQVSGNVFYFKFTLESESVENVI